VSAFDPPPDGDGKEHDDQAARAIDGDPATYWETETYRSDRFGGLKDGVGLVLTLDGSHELHRLDVTSATQGWAAKVFVAGTPGRTVADWGPAVADQSGLNGNATFDLAGHQGGAVLLWITNVGPARKAQVAKVAVFS
jgi:hypothetical protein